MNFDFMGLLMVGMNFSGMIGVLSLYLGLFGMSLVNFILRFLVIVSFGGS